MIEEKFDHDHAVSLTAHIVAYYRGLEGIFHPHDKLIDDPYALVLGGTIGQKFFDQHISSLNTTSEKALIRGNDTQAARTRIIDDSLQSFVSDGINQIVVLASGLDARAWRLNFQPNANSKLKFFELDYQDVIDYKCTCLKKVAAVLPSDDTFEHHFVAVDLADPRWSHLLLNTGEFDPNQPTVWLIEGLTMYLTEEQLRTLIAKVYALSAGGSKIIIDFMGHSWDGMVYSTTIGFVDDPTTLMESMHFRGTFDLYCDIAAKYGRREAFKGYGVFIGCKND